MAATVYTVERCITQALIDAGLIQRDETPNASEQQYYMDKLNDICLFMQTQGLKLWLNSIRAITLIAGTQKYTLGPAGSGLRELRALEAYYVRSTGESNPLNLISWNEWNMLSAKDQEGTPNSFFPDKRQGNLDIYLWLIPNTQAASGRVDVLVQSPCTQVTAISDTMNFPLEWFLALRWALADEAASGQPAAVIERCQSKAMMYRQALEDWDVEDASTKFAPDAQTMGFSRIR